MTHKKLQSSHLLLLAVLNHRNNDCVSHSFGGEFHLRVVSNRSFPDRQFPFVVGSGLFKNEAIASPSVAMGFQSRFHAIIAIQTVLMRLHNVTTIIMARLNCKVQCSSTLYAISKSAPTLLDYKMLTSQRPRLNAPGTRLNI